MASPARKRQRFSSPTYEAEFDDFDEDGLKELDRIELTLSQLQQQPPAIPSSPQVMPRSSQSISPNARKRRMKAIMDALQSDDGARSGCSDPAIDKRVEDDSLRFKSAAALPLGSSHARTQFDHDQSSSPIRNPPERDCSEWFERRGPDISLLGFQAASKCVDGISAVDSEKIPSLPERNSENATLLRAGATVTITAANTPLEPSKAALERWSRKLEDWSTEDEIWVKEATTSQAPLKRSSAIDSARPPLAPVINSPSHHMMRSPQPRSFSTPVLNRTTPHRPRGFRSPLLPQPFPRISNDVGGGLTPNKSSTVQIAPPHFLGSGPGTKLGTPDHHQRTISDSSLLFRTPAREPARETTRSAVRHIPKPAFSTPFKKGMKPGEPGRLAIETAAQTNKRVAGVNERLGLQTGPVKVTKSGKLALKDCGMKPQRHASDELEDMGVSIVELSQITPQTAPFYVFHTSDSRAPSSEESSSSRVSLGLAEALAHLHRTGRNTTREWVDNHWALILWKLAGLAVLDPVCEATPSRRWCWGTVLQQLEARHDKEFGKGARPALRLITAGDAPAGSPLVLVVTAILSSEEQQVGKSGRVVRDASAEVEVSDGWYRLRAFLDAPLARAVIRGTIRPGRKIAVAGAKLHNERKDPCEILEAYNSCTLSLSGNGSHLAPWHAKLGFQAEPFVASLGSLTPDGGHVPLMDFIVEKVHPVAFFEFLPGDRPGEKRREGPRGEAEERRIEDDWSKRREAAESKVRDELSARWDRWDGLAERLERAANGKFKASPDDMPPDHIEDLFDELDALPSEEVGTFVRQLGADECGWLARYLRRRSEKDRENAAEEVDIEVNHLCPQREVRNFRIVQVRDARTVRRPANRIAHLCIWDVLSLCVSEGGKAGGIESGQRFLTTNLVPMQQSCWMGRGKDDMVYLSTTRNSRFYRLK